MAERWIKLRIEVDDNDSTMCCNCRYRHFGLDCKHVSRCPACLDADITDKLEKLAELEKRNRILEMTIVLMRGYKGTVYPISTHERDVCPPRKYRITTCRDDGNCVICTIDACINQAEQEIESEVWNGCSNN